MTFQQTANTSPEQNSSGSLLLGAIFGGLTSELGQAVDMASDVAEVASEFHTYNYKKQQGNFTLGHKNSLGGMFANKASGMMEDKPDIQKRYLTMDYTYAPKPAMSMRMAA
jgi:hypothetical protein